MNQKTLAKTHLNLHVTQDFVANGATIEGVGCRLPRVAAQKSVLDNSLQTHILGAAQVPHCITHSTDVSPQILVRAATGIYTEFCIGNLCI